MNLARRKIANNRLVVMLAPKRWPNDLPEPILVADTEAKMRAVSLLRGFATQDGQPIHAPDLTPSQAHDVVRHILSPSPAPSAAIPGCRRGGAFL